MTNKIAIHCIVTALKNKYGKNAINVFNMIAMKSIEIDEKHKYIHIYCENPDMFRTIREDLYDGPLEDYHIFLMEDRKTLIDSIALMSF